MRLDPKTQMDEAADQWEKTNSRILGKYIHNPLLIFVPYYFP